MNKKLSKLFSVIIFIFLAFNSTAQNNFKYSAELDTINASGFYQILLLPEVVSKLQPNFADIRIINTERKQIPYLLQTDKPVFRRDYFTEMPIISTKKEADKQTHVVIENKAGRAINELILIIKNADASRSITLSGSDDKKQWYVIKENIFLNNLFTTTDDRFVQVLSFPSSKYVFFKIIIHGENVLPVNIISAGVYGQNLINGKFILVPAPAISQKDSSDGFSYVTLQFNDTYAVDRLELQVNGSKFFKRRIQIYNKDEVLDGSKDAFVASSEPAVFLMSLKAGKLLLKIQNGDNPPLKITAASAFQLNRYLLAWLEKNIDYKIVFSDSLATLPHYDLEFFKDSIRSMVPLTYASIQKNNIDQKQNNIASDNKKWMWLIIIVVLIGLLFFTYRITKEINNKQ